MKQLITTLFFSLIIALPLAYGQSAEESDLREQLKANRLEWDTQQKKVQEIKEEAVHRWYAFSETCNYRDVSCHELKAKELQAIIDYADAHISTYDQECKEWNRITSEGRIIKNKLFGDPIHNHSYCDSDLDDVIAVMKGRLKDIERDLEQAKIAAESFRKDEERLVEQTEGEAENQNYSKSTSENSSYSEDTTLEDINARSQAVSQAYDKMGDEIGAELADVFTGELEPQNIMNITNSILSSGLITDATAFGAIGIGGGVAAAAIGILGDAKKSKIESNAKTLNTKSDELQAEYQNFQAAINNNNDAALLKSHYQLSSIENEIFESVDYLVKKADQAKLVEVKEKLLLAREKRLIGVNKVKNKMEGDFHNMTADMRQSYVSSGTLSDLEIQHLANPISKPGNVDGRFRFYDDSWRLLKIGTYQSGIPNGKWTYYENGIKTHQVNLVESVIEGNAVIYHENGSVKSEMTYVAGKIDGQVTAYYPNGKLLSEMTYKMGAQNGDVVSYHENGEIRSQGTFVEGRLIGTVIGYHENGKIRKEVFYNDNGLRIGKSNEYSQEGELIRVVDYGDLKGSDENTVLLRDYKVDPRIFQNSASIHTMESVEKINKLLDEYMIPVDGGTYDMGGKLNRAYRPYINYPAVPTTVTKFSISKYEITNELWEAVMGYIMNAGENAKHPARSLDYREILVFFRYLNALTEKNYRLPTEAEWEFAAKGGNQSKGYKYSGSNKLKEVAWVWMPQEVFPPKTNTHYINLVGQLEPNELGLYDMSGNVAEYCSDWVYGIGKGLSITGYQSIPPATGEYDKLKVVKGGGIGMDNKNNELALTKLFQTYSPINRGGMTVSNQSINAPIGFRIAHD